MKIGVICSIGRNTGAELRAQYFISALRKQGIDVYYFKPHRRFKNLEYLVYIPINILRSFYKRFDYFMSLKPFPTGVLPAIVNKIFCKGKIIVDVDDLDH